MTSRRWLRFLVLTCVFASVSREARAQTDTDLTNLIGLTYIENQIDLLSGIGNLADFDFPTSFGPFSVESVMNSALVLETAAFPIGSSSGGFTYVFDATSGAALRSSPSFGPAFAERPLTGGRGKLTVGLTYLHRSFDEIEGQSLDGSGLKFWAPLTNAVTGGKVDLIESTLNLAVTSDTATMFATYGVLDKLDVSVAVPIQHVSLNATLSSELVRFGPTSGVPGSEIPAAVASRSGSASGIGDVAIRAKYNILNAPQAAVAAGLDVRLPTGDEYNLLGTGRTRTKVYGAFSSNVPGSRMAKFFPHVNFGYTFDSEAQAEELFFFGSEFSYAAGAEYVAHPRLTIVGDIFGRSLADEGRLQQRAETYQLVRSGPKAQEEITVTELQFQQGARLNSTLAAIGAKYNPRSTFIVSAHLLFQLTDSGIKSAVTPVIGFDYSF
jgi:hypothetical protein